VPIFEVVTEAPLKVTGEAYIVELASAVEHIDAFAPSHISVDQIPMLFQHSARQVFQMLGNEGLPTGHYHLLSHQRVVPPAKQGAAAGEIWTGATRALPTFSGL